ncbi:SprT family zinc-dependent metalloprotease [Pasteurella multocida]|uniref:SprT family zinc-dependent metalloprotease n=1 Tax=Pasteurella multocida TaxID=747 RepID=UPI000F6D7281|nr:SprT family zinc-dependent metalloprotease [Pasteurella multocida]MEB3465552.1 SprT family zinc-dependent metalloprotease [Pasteurella multocida]MEB3503949.1 SprT family zinc-dependent metalloprotease [Pasteurella multocida]WRK09536.1 SprT family zinc-dependent metalloprotease [Pasteurella multocida]VEJ13949.1 SprT family metallopeptidase [Pasteurella multocida subsp. septica]HDR0627394.1 SprT family zinc-dependent metalloprotease [Pasteurella multocida]
MPIMQPQTQLRHLNRQVQRKLIQCLQLASDYFDRTFSMPTVHYNVRGMKAGVAYLQQNEIRLNPILLLENSAAFIQQVVPHELAHLLVYQVFGRVKPHGEEWQRVMQDVFHLTPEVCHQFDVTRVRGPTFPYYCQCKLHYLTQRRHHNIQKNNIVYLCKNCKSRLIKKT